MAWVVHHLRTVPAGSSVGSFGVEVVVCGIDGAGIDGACDVGLVFPYLSGSLAFVDAGLRFGRWGAGRSTGMGVAAGRWSGNGLPSVAPDTGVGRLTC